jgi:hypothetical protein
MRKVRRMKEEEKNRQPKGSFLKVGTARRAVPNFRREAPFPEQGRLRRENGTPAASGSSPTPRRARHPYPFFSKGATAPLVRLVFSIFPKGRGGSPSGPTFCSGRLSQPFLWFLLMAGFLFCVSLTGCERSQPPGPPPPVAQTPSPTPKIELGEPPRMP